MGELLHRVDPQEGAIVEEGAIPVHDPFQLFRPVVQHTRVEGQIMASGDHIQRIHLDALRGPNGLDDASRSTPAAAGPESLAAEEEAPAGLVRDEWN